MQRTPALFGALVLTSVVALSSPASATTEPAEGGSEFAELLAMMPADAVTADSALISYTDMSLLWERLDVGADEQARLDAMSEFAAPETFAVLPQVFDNRQAQVDDARAEVGFSVLEIDRELGVTAPPRSIFIDVTSVSPDGIDAAIESDPLWSDRLTRVDGEHGSYVDWGEGDTIDASSESPFHSLGRAGQLAVLGDPATAVRTLDVADVEAVLAATAGDGESVATNDVVAPIVAGLGDMSVMQALIQPGPQPFAPPPNASPEQVERLRDEMVLLQPYLGIAIVETADGDGSRIEVLIVNADEAAAQANAELVEAALAEGVDLRTMRPLADLYPGATVSVDGTVIVVDVSGEAGFRQAYSQLIDRSLFPSA